MKDKKLIEELAAEHAEWEAELIQTILAEIIKPVVFKVAYDNFIHGAKHQEEIACNESQATTPEATE